MNTTLQLNGRRSRSDREAIGWQLGDRLALRVTGSGTLDLPQEAAERIRAWAASNGALAEVWLFGSRAKGTARPDSDVDIALVLLPAAPAPPGGIAHDWPAGNYLAMGSTWRRELEAIVGRHVSLELFTRPGEQNERAEAAKIGAVRLWP